MSSSDLPGSHRAGEEQFQVSPPGGIGSDHGLHVLKVVDCGVRAHTGFGLDLQQERAAGWNFTERSYKKSV